MLGLTISNCFLEKYGYKQSTFDLNDINNAKTIFTILS